MGRLHREASDGSGRRMIFAVAALGADEHRVSTGLARQPHERQQERQQRKVLENDIREFRCGGSCYASIPIVRVSLGGTDLLKSVTNTEPYCL